MWRWFFLLPFLLFAEELEVRLSTKTPLAPVYLSAADGAEEMREVLEMDLNRSGFARVVPKDAYLEASLQKPDLRKQFDLTLWKREKIPFCLAAKVAQNRLEVTAFNVEQGTSKQYPAAPLERRAIHKLADAIQKDLFGKEGIASLKLLYTVRTKNPQKGLGWLSEVWVCDADGAGATQLTRENSYCLSPMFFPDSSTEFFYTSEKSGQSKIYRASLTKPEGQLFIDMRGNQALAAMKGKHMAFITDVAGRPDLFLQTFDGFGAQIGKARQLFSAPRATQASPTFSPDGRKVAFVSDKDGTPRIYVLDTAAKQARPQLLTKRNRNNTSCSWSPDGTKLAYSAKVDETRQIWMYDFLKDEEIALTTGPGDKDNPSWAPDSFHLVYNIENEEDCILYLMHLNGDPIAIGKGRFASWQQSPYCVH